MRLCSTMSIEQQQLEATINTLEAQRVVLGAALVDAALKPLQARLVVLAAAQSDSGAAAGLAQALKQVTVLFLDVVGSTTLSQHLDPEDVHAVMDGALTRCTVIVESHLGKVLNYAGDSLLAVFGADEVREDDAERAVLAGLALLEEGRRQGELVLRRYGQAGFNVRVGIHTGAVLLGGGVDGEGSIRGFTVNVAARMEQSAPAGAVRISHDTYRQVRGVFDVLPQAPIEVKGVEIPMLTYLVQRRKPRAFRVATRGIEGVETRMVGRDAELEHLQNAFKRLYTENKLRVVTVVAEAGIGKSRLLYEFENWAEARSERFYFFQGRAHPLTQSQPYGLLRDILTWRLQIADSDSMEVAKQKIEEGLAPLFLADDGAEMAQAHAHLLGHLIGLDFANSKHIHGIQDDGKQIRSRGFHAAAQMFRRVSAQMGVPLLLLLDDLQHADEGSLDFLNYLCQVNFDLPLLILAVTRPTLHEWPADRLNGVDKQRMVLSPLDKGSSRMLVSELLQKLPEVPSILRELITSGADGNPFYMEELVKMLIEVGAIVCGAERWHVNPERLLDSHVPQTLTGVLQARLDGMKPADKLALQQASVIGFVFWDRALAALDARAPDALPSLVQHEFTLVHREALLDAGVEGVREYAFSHQILHQVTYDTVLKRTRRELHAKAARWLSGLTGARANDFLGATAEHFVKAGENPQACEFFTRAAEHAATRYAHEAAMAYVAKALALTELQPSLDASHQEGRTDQCLLHWRLFDVHERTLDLQGRRTEQQADIDALQLLADALDDDRRRGDVAWRRSTIAMRTGDYRTMREAACQTIAMAESVSDFVLGLRGQHRLALALTYLGDIAAGSELAQTGLSSARTLGFRQLEALFLNALSVIAESRVDRLPSLDFDEQDLQINRELGNRRNEAIALGNLGSGWLRLGEHVQARRYLEESLRLASAVGDRATQPDALTNLSVLALREDDPLQALQRAQAALEIAIAVQSPEFEAGALCALGDAELALRHDAPATLAYQRAHGVALANDSAAQHDAKAGLARVALAQGDRDAALQAAEGLLAHLTEGGTLAGTKAPYLIRLTCWQVLAAVGESGATDLLATVHADLQALAATISDAALRSSFLNNIPEHRAIVAAWSVRHAAHI